MLNDSQQRKALVLSLLMVMLAQTAYIQSYRGWTLPDQTNPSLLNAGCNDITRTSGTPIYVDVTQGSDDWAGTWSCPKATLSDALNISSANDEIILASGLYHENVTVSNKDNLLIRAADGAQVVFDGTQSIADDLNVSWGAADSDGIQEVTLPVDGWQLFLAYDEQVPARWPNAGFDDETVFNRSYWAEGTLTGSNNAYTKGWLTDAGPETGVHTGLNETVNASGLDPIGAIAVMNLGSFRSNSRIITDWNPNNGTFAYDGNGVGWKTKHHAYILEGKRELIDEDGEWWFNNTNNRLHYKTPSGQNANDLDLRMKVQPFAISVDGSDGVTIQGIDFFGTTVNFNNCDGCSFTNATLEYPSTSKRGLGIAGESEDDRWMTRFYRSKNSFVDNISITNTDGGAIEFQGSPGQSHNNTVNNSYFHAIDWSAADQKGLMVTIYEGGRDMYFTNNTVHLTGASSVLSIGDAPKVFYNEVWDVGHLQTDGAVVQVMQAEAPGAEIAYNWIHDVIKYGARFDAPIGEAGEGRNGTMHHNVIWNATGGLMVKGDYHNIHNNTVFNSSGKNDMIILTDDGVNNGNSTIHQNAADTMADHRTDSWSSYPLPSGTYWNNWNGYVNTTDSVWNQLVDPGNEDFRPKANSHLDNMSAGAYDAGVSNPWTAGVSWSYSPMSNPISGCMDSIAINYNSNAVFSDGSCIYTTLSSSSSTLSLEVGVSMTPYTLTYDTPFLADDKQTAASSGSVGAGTNIALDSNGAVHICSKVIGSDNLYYTTNVSGSWQSATLDSSGNVGGDCFIILDSDDDIHITYRDDSNTNLKYATKALSTGIAASNWAISTMDNNGDVGNFGSMAVDANDTLHVAYYAASGTVLKYATLTDGSTTWSKEVVESTNDVGKYTSIALDSNGNPHITYYDDTNDDLRYTHKMGSSWVFTTLDSVGVSGKGTSLAIDSNDHLHVAYKTNSTEVAYMTNRSGSWVKTTLDANSTGTWGVNYINIMLDEGDDPHVVYSDMVDYDIFYMSNTRGTWERILVAGDSISKTSEAEMDENGGIHVAYYIDGSFDDVGYAAVRSLAHRPVFEISPDLPQGLSLGAENGTVFGTPMEYLDLTEFTVWANTTRTSASTTFSMNVDWELMASVDYLETPRNTAITPITFNWTAWSSGVLNSTTTIATTGDNGNYNGIVVDSNDKVHIVYYRDDNANLMYSTNASGSWQTSTVESSNNVGKYCNLAIDGNDGLHISYQYNSGNALKYAYKSSSSSSWTKTTVDNTGGKYTSIATDSNNNPHIAYRDSGGDVGYATKSSGGSWTYGTIQSAGDIAYTSIAVDADDHIHIAYYDSNNKDMYHLTNTSGSWARTFLEDIGTNTGGTALDIAIDPTTDEPGISYFDMDATSLKYTYYTGSAWSSATVENSADYGRFNSIVYDSVGNVHISHERNSADDLYYTSDKTGSWLSTAVDTTNSVGTYTSIAVDSNDDLHIAYRHNSWTRTMHATVQGYKISSAERANVSGATCSISPSLPSGLSLNQGTCTISGTPTSHGFNTTYNVTATSSTGVSKSGEFKLWITQIAPSITYTGSPFTFTVDTAISSITPTNTGDTAFWSVSPSLPSGLSLGAGGVISGTPSVEASAADYTITASNPGGESSATISITVNAQPPSGLSYATENMTLTKGTAMTANTPSVSGGAVTSWEISPSLPTGLSLSSSTGEISGTPTVLQTTAVTYTVWANNSGGSTSANVNITINDAAPLVSYSTTEITGTKGVAISPSIGPTTSGGTITSWEISPSPGSAFQFNTGNGYISGTPSVLLTRTQYTIWANNSGGSSVAYVNVTINDVAPNTIVYSSHDLVLEKGTAMTTTTPAIGGGTVTTWEISPSIPNGLSFSSTTGAISGTPSSLQTTAVAYTIWANNSGGSASTQMNITINDQIASISYSTPVDISNNRLLSTITPTTTGGAVTSWEITPSLPTGLSFGTSNGSIWGTPENVTSNVTYTIYANNSGGSASATLTLNMNWTLTPSVEGAYITRNSSLSSDITWEWDYDPLEAQNLSLATGEWNTCAIRDNGEVYCWGRNGNGQIGNGQTGTAACGTSGHKCKDQPTQTNSLGSDAVSIAFGHQHACALLDNGAVKCWGRNNAGQLGASGGDKDTPQTVNLGTGRTAMSIYAGGHYTCAILDDASVKCWGQNDYGQLGIGSNSNTNTPTSINSLGTGRTAVSLATAFSTVCALLDDGSVKCWGRDNFGQLGDGSGIASTNSPPSSSINLGTNRTAKAITGGEFHFCAILDDDSIVCWGRGVEGQLGSGGTGGTYISYVPSSATGSLGTGRYAVAIDAGYDHTCALLDNGDVNCWGSDAEGQLGNGATSSSNVASLISSNSINLGTGRTAISISAGGTHTCAQLDNGLLKCWGNRADGQVGDNGGFNSPFDRTSPSAVSHGYTYLDTGAFPSAAVSGATCGISPALPTGMSLTSGTCAITGTPTVTAVNATYTVWANISGQSFSGQVWLEVGLNAPIPSYSPNSYTFTKDTTISTILPSNTGGEVTTWAINGSLPSGLSFGTSNGSIWGTPDTITASNTYTVWANNSAGSGSTTITLAVNDVAPSISYSLSSLSLLKGAQMSALAVTNSGGAIVSCSVSPSLPNGMSLSSTCELSGTPTVAATNASYTITATNTGGSDSTSIYIEVLNSGGTLTVTPTHSTGSVNATLAGIAASYSHSLTIPSWTSGVTNTSVMINNSGSVAGTAIAAWDNGDLVIAWTRPIYSGTTQHVLAISVYDGSSWTTQDIDTASRTGYRPSIAIDNQGALHIAYLDRDNTNLRYATNASGSWVLSTLDNSSVNPNNDAAKTGIAIDNRGHVHIIHPVQGSGVWVLNYTTNVSGSFVSTTITDTTKDDGKYASLAIAGNGSLHISVYRDSGGSDLRYYTDESGVWTNETVHTGNNYGKDSAIALNSKDEVVIVYRRDDGSDDIYMSVGNRGSWTSSQVASNRNAMYLAVAIDSNDDVHISSHNSGGSSKDLEYFTNSSGSWVRTTLDSGVGGIFGSMVIDSNDDVHIAHADTIGANDLQYATAKGSGKGVTPNPVFSVSPSLPDGLILNWKTGEITGTPTVASANTTYTLTALALGTTTTATFTLHVTGAPGDISYNDILGTNGVAITPVAPTISTNSTTGSATSWAINASLPTGLTFGTSNGTIWGTPTQIIAGAVFTIWANNSAGSKSTTINITINDVSVSSFAYASENITLSYYHTMTTTTPTTTGGSATSWAISPSLPSGLTFNTATGAISGTPETLQTTAVTYTIWANNSGGSFSDQINITINDHPPAPINYFVGNITLDYNQTMTPLGNFEVKPDLIASGEDHTCAIQSDGSVRCWGEGDNGRLGYGGTANKNTPTATSSLGSGRTAIDITAGGDHTCAVLDNGSVACWGLNNYGQLGDGTTTNRQTPTQTLSLGRPAVAVEAGMHVTCALLDNGSVSCWGRNHAGQLGRGYTNSTNDLHQRTPGLTLPMPGGHPVVALDISHYMVCGVLSNGSIACWSQYGGGNTPSLKTFFDSSNPAIDIATGRYSGCATMENGSVTCWGTGWLGTGGSSQSANPGVIWPNLGSGRTAVEVEIGRKHRCALLDDDSVKCWGDDQYGQMGNGAGQSNKNTPSSVTFSSNLGLHSMSSGHWHTCIATKTNEMYCWGDGAYSKLGDGSSNHNQIPGKTSHFSGTNPAKAHGEITSWAIHPALPTGLSFGSANGTLYGTPTAPLGQTNFTIYANNSGGSTSTIVTITINDQAPGPFQYNPENNTLTNNTATTIAPSFTTPGGTVTSWVINASLPSGLSFGTNNGTIYGTPTELRNQTAYTVWANNSGGSSVAYLNITVVDELPTLSYSPSTLVLTINNQSSDLPLNATLTGSGAITSWAISSTLPAGLNFGTSNGTIWGIPTVMQTTAVIYTIWANNSGGSTSATITITINDEAPGPFEYISENNTWTNNTEVHLAPQFINQSTGNGSTWQVADINSGAANSSPGFYMDILVGDTLYFSATDGSTGSELWAYNTSNHSTWRVADIFSGSTTSWPGAYMHLLVGDTIYFSADDGSTGHELWAHDTSNHSTWQVADINSGSGSSNPGSYISMLVGDTLYFGANDGSTGYELWAHDTSNLSTWRVIDLNSGSGHGYPGYSTGDAGETLVGDTLYFAGNDGSTGRELWAHNTSNHSTWQVADIYSGSSSNPGTYMMIAVGDTLYFDASDGTYRHELWAHDTSNLSTWRVADIYSGAGSSNPGQYMNGFVVGDAVYFSAADGSDGSELWAHDTSNHSTWQVADINTGSGHSKPGEYLTIIVGDTLYFDASDGSNSHALWAHDTSNRSTWRVFDNAVSGHSYPETVRRGAGDLLVGDTLYFSASDGSSGDEWWAHDTSNHSTWRVADINSGAGSSDPGYYMEGFLVGDTMYFSAVDGSTGRELWAHRPSIIGYNTNTGGNVTSWAISASLPSGLSFGTNNGTIYGTPTELWTQTSYIVWANNSGGSSVAYLNITVVDEVPTLSYSPSTLVLTKGNQSSDLPLNATLTGPGTITSWEINATLPAGLSFGTTNGTIWGIPTVLQTTAVTYTVWANNSGGSTSATINITIYDQAPVISYSTTEITGTKDVAISPHVGPTTSGGTVISWEISPDPGSAFHFNTGNGYISGTPSILLSRTQYTIWANNSGGSSVAYVNVTINDQLPTLSYSPENLTLTKGQASSDLPLNATLTGSGAIISWAINATLPAGLNFGTTNGTIWGIPTVLQTTAVTYTIWANNTGGSTSATINITIIDEAPGSFEYIPENNTWTNNSEVHLAPLFINQTVGNNSFWKVGTGQAPGTYFEYVVGEVIYFDTAASGSNNELHAYSTNNGTSWLVADINVGGSGSNPGYYMSPILVGEVLYFSANDGVDGHELWGFNTSNGSVWQVADIFSGVSGSNPGFYLELLVGDTLYFSANDGSTGIELWAHNTSNHSTWQAADIHSTGSSTPGLHMSILVGDTMYFSATDGSTGSELWAHDTSNHSTWQVADISSGSPAGSPGQNMNPILIDDTLFFDATDGSTGIELWAHDIANHSTWQVADIRSGGLSSSPGLYMAVSVGDTVYFSANDGSVGHELWAHDTSNSSTWRVADINSGGDHSSPGEYMEILVGDTIYFSAYDGTLTQRLWAHDTSNRTTWKVDDAGQNPSHPVSVGDTIYYSAQTDVEGRELWVYDLYNGSAWMVADLSGSASSNPLQYLGLAFDSTLYFSGSDVLSYGAGMFAYSPGIVDYRTNTGGAVTSWVINASLPSGVFIGTTNGTIYGTPTELWNQTSYMVWANNSGGSSVAYLNITVVDEVPVLSYSPNNLVLTKGNQSSDLPLNATLTGPGEIVTWTIEPSLPSGLNFGSNNGTIWGIPTVLQLSSVTYTVWGNNTGGSTSATVTITIIDQVPDISYSPNELNLTVNTTSSSVPLFPTNTGGAVTSWVINASLPTGLSFGSSNGTIYGTSTELWNRTSYMVWANNSGGSNVAYLNITVVDEVPGLSYSPENLTLTMGLQHTDLPLNATLTGSGTIVSWAIEPSLPAGLNFGSNNGTIWGIPTVLQLSPVTYTVWGNNSGGSLNVTINITVIDTVPDIAYSPSELELMLYTSSNDLPLSPTNSGGNITSWAINASLPSGVFFGTTNGTIYGTPTELWNRTTYMVWANNSGGSSLAYLNITVDHRPPMFSYSPENLTLYKNTNSSDLPLSPTISFTGHDAPTDWTLVGTLPSGLNFGTTNGTFWGTPTQRMAKTNYIVYGNNTGGSFSRSINITVLHEAPMFTYSFYNLTLVNNTAMTALEATSTGGDITSWRADPNMPAGLTLHAVNGTIYGLPTVVQSMTMYTIWGNNSGGSHAVYVNITIYDPAITLDYNPENLTLTRGVAMNGLSPSYSGIVDDWTIVPSLPAGLNFNHGVVSGTPNVNMTTTMFTVWANNTGGSSNHTINITILEPIVVLDYNPENLTLIRGVQMTTLFPIVSGGNVSNWSITPTLPNGLNFGDGVINGASTVNMTLTTYTVWATTSGGTTSHTVNITVLEPSGNLSYIPENITLTRGLAMPTLHPTYSGGNIENWSIHPALPAGLNFNNGVVSGLPAVNMTTSMFTVYANNSGGSAAATINITILEPVVDLLYNPNNLTLIRGTTMSPLLPTVSGGNVSEWSVVGVLPEGLNFSNGVFSGTPLVNMTQTQYLVYANTTGGSETAWVNITVLEPAVDVSYNPYNITLIRNETMTSVSPTVGGGNVSDWAIVPDLPAGLNFTDGVISGTPEVNMTTTMFTIWANTTGGAASTTVNITILEPVVDFLYNPNNLILTRNETMNTTSPIFGNDAMPDEWGILPTLPAGLDFTNGTISGTPEVNMTSTVFTIFANNSAGTATAFLTITILEPVANVVYVPENITLTRGESNASIVPTLGGGMVASWSISPDLPEGMVFDNGSITGVPLVNSTNTTYTVMALNSGGMAYAFLNITVVEPVAVLAFNEHFLGTRGETLFNATVNNTGGMVETWEIEPALPDGVGLWNGWLYGTPSVNLSETTFTIWANNSGGSANITFTLEVREPVAIIDYPEAEITLVNGVSRGRIIPILDGGVPDNWSIEPALPSGLTFFNGNIIGVATMNLSQTTYTVWANNSGGIATTTFNLTVNQPTFYVRYPMTRVVLDVNETWVRLNPIYYFGDNQNPVWSITPTLPEGLTFENGRITGTPTEPSKETNYTIAVVGEMVPVEIYVIIEVRDKVNNTVESVRNTTEVDQFTLPEYEEKDDSFDMYWICFPILLVLTLLGVAGINNFLALTAKDDDDPENDDKGDDEGDESGGD